MESENRSFKFALPCSFLLAFLLAVLFAATTQAQEQQRNAPKTVAVPVQNCGNGVVATVMVKGHEARVLLDTWASMTVLSSSLHLPTSSQERFVASGVDGKSTKVRTAEVEIKFGDQYFGVTALVRWNRIVRSL